MSQAEKTKQEPVAMKCRSEKCDSMLAEQLPYPNDIRMYRCIKCKNTWGLRVGGTQMNLNG